jgi:hypothetical protein
MITYKLLKEDSAISGKCWYKNIPLTTDISSKDFLLIVDCIMFIFQGSISLSIHILNFMHTTSKMKLKYTDIMIKVMIIMKLADM